MKTPLCFIIAVAAFLILPVDFTTMFSALFVAGLAAIAISEYRWNRRLSRAAAAVIAGANPPARLPLAA